MKLVRLIFRLAKESECLLESRPVINHNQNCNGGSHCRFIAGCSAFDKSKMLCYVLIQIFGQTFNSIFLALHDWMKATVES